MVNAVVVAVGAVASTVTVLALHDVQLCSLAPQISLVSENFVSTHSMLEPR